MSKDRCFCNADAEQKCRCRAGCVCGDGSWRNEDSVRDKVFALLRRRMDGVPKKVADYADAVHVAREILRAQEQTATLPRVREYYRRESDRLRQRAEALTSKIAAF